LLKEVKKISTHRYDLLKDVGTDFNTLLRLVEKNIKYFNRLLQLVEINGK